MRSSSGACGRRHLARKFVVADRPRLTNGGIKVFSQRLLKSPEQRVLQCVVEEELDAIPNMTDGEFADRGRKLTRTMQFVDDHREHGHKLDALNAHIVLEKQPETRVGGEQSLIEQGAGHLRHHRQPGEGSLDKFLLRRVHDASSSSRALAAHSFRWAAARSTAGAPPNSLANAR